MKNLEFTDAELIELLKKDYDLAYWEIADRHYGKLLLNSRFICRLNRSYHFDPDFLVLCALENLWDDRKKLNEHDDLVKVLTQWMEDIIHKWILTIEKEKKKKSNTDDLEENK